MNYVLPVTRNYPLEDRQVVVLDRDGTIVVDKPYLGDPAGLEFTPGAAEGLRRLHAMRCRVVVITNQSGVGRGLISPAQVFAVNKALRTMVGDSGGLIEAVYVCPHRPDTRCGCRKPAPALLHQAALELGFEVASSIVIGDKATDVGLGKSVGARTMIIASAGEMNECGADFVVTGLHQAAEIIAAHASRGPDAVTIGTRNRARQA